MNVAPAKGEMREVQKVLDTVSKNLPNKVDYDYNTKYSILTLYYGPLSVKDKLSETDVMNALGIKGEIDYISHDGKRQVYNIKLESPTISRIHCVISKTGTGKYSYMIQVSFKEGKVN